MLERRGTDLLSGVVVSLVVAGAALRVVAVRSHGQFYGDEASLALNLAGRSFGGLVRVLDFEQVAPVPFLWAEKLATLMGGVNELALRVVPLVAAIVSLGLLWIVARRLLGEGPAALATVLAACSALLINYASEAKQYSTDVLITLVVLWLVLAVLETPVEKGAWTRLVLGGALALWASQPAVFVLAGAGLALALDPRFRAEPGSLRRLTAAAATWIGVFCILYFFLYKPSEGDAFLRTFWAEKFLVPGTPRFMHRVVRAATAALVIPVISPLPGPWGEGGALFRPVVLMVGILVCALFVLGLIYVVRARGRAAGILLAGPYLAVLGAAILGKYPAEARLLLFLAPLLFIIYGAALWAAVQILPVPWRMAGYGALLLAIVAASFPHAVEQALHPERERDLKPVLQAMAQRAPSAPVYILAPASGCHCSLWVFYTMDWAAPDTARLAWFARIPTLTREPNPISSGSVPARDAALTATFGGRQELQGEAALLAKRPDGRWLSPDSTWVARESERIRRAASPRVWLWAAETYPEALIVDLLRGIRERGGRIRFAARALGATAWEIVF